MGFWRNNRLGTSLLAFLMGSTASIDALSAQQAGSVGAVNSGATGQPPGAGSRSLGVGSSIVQNERIATDATGTVHLTFNDRSALNVGRNSSVVIDKFVYNASAGYGEMAVSVAKGAARFVGGQVSHTTGATVKTPAASVGVRGGTITVIVNGGMTTVIVHSGVATVTNSQGTRQVRAGLQVTVATNSTPEATQPIDMGLLRSVNFQLTSQGRQTAGSATPPTDGQAAQNQVGISRRAVQTPNYDLPAAGDDLARGFATTVNQPYP